MTTTTNWRYPPTDTVWKTPYEVISMYADVVGYGGIHAARHWSQRRRHHSAAAGNHLKMVWDWFFIQQLANNRSALRFLLCGLFFIPSIRLQRPNN